MQGFILLYLKKFILNGELIVLHGEDELPASVTVVVMSSPIYIPASVTK